MKAVRRGFIKSIPILCSYLFVGMAYGITMQNAGFFWYDAAIVSILVYTGAFQFVLISLLSSGSWWLAWGTVLYMVLQGDAGKNVKEGKKQHIMKLDEQKPLCYTRVRRGRHKRKFVTSFFIR